MGKISRSVNYFNFYIRTTINLYRKIPVILREQQQDDLVDVFAKSFNHIETTEKVQIRTDYVIVDRNGFDGSLEERKFV